MGSNPTRSSLGIMFPLPSLHPYKEFNLQTWLVIPTRCVNSVGSFYQKKTEEVSYKLGGELLYFCNHGLIRLSIRSQIWPVTRYYPLTFSLAHLTSVWWVSSWLINNVEYRLYCIKCTKANQQSIPENKSIQYISAMYIDTYKKLMLPPKIKSLRHKLLQKVSIYSMKETYYITVLTYIYE